MAEGPSFLGKGPVETMDIDVRALEQRPGIVLMVGGIDLADGANGNAPLALIARERFERRGREHAAKVPNHSFDHVIPQQACVRKQAKP